MSKLLSANLHRLMKNKLFLLMTLGIFIFSAYVMISFICSDIIHDSGNVLEYRFYDSLPYAGLVISAFVALFIGTDISDGTIRNKISVGHTRSDIYFADLITCFAAVTAFLAAWVMGGMTGIPFLGIWSTGIKSNLIAIAVSYLSILALTAIFCILAHSIPSKAMGAVASIFLSIFIIYGGSYFYGALNEPETSYEYVSITAEGTVEYGNEILNPAYVEEAYRPFYELMSYVFPTGQQIRIADNYGVIEQPVFMIVCSATVTIIAASCGYLLFRIKDLR